MHAILLLTLLALGSVPAAALAQSSLAIKITGARSWRAAAVNVTAAGIVAL
jgi:hypothetical protein